ncbi:DUF1127 domain-containing protein [Shimia sediminis]|uniref:DUF1127 domain-containing protein n=1 Tax=Shimia sediminis TaxID=2497945 RepID=UPI000F8E1145|nr:DUF1127 domain-containing protein [Shimia sediminis]
MTNATIAIAEFGFFNAFRDFFADLRVTWAERTAFHRTYNELSNLTDRELADIGLRRSDIAEVCAQAARQ